MFKLKLKSDFLKSFLVLMTGTAIAQVINVLASPILTRLYSQDEMGELGLYMRIVAFVAAISTLRYELSLPLPKSNGHSFQLYRLAIRISLIVIMSLALVVGLYSLIGGFENSILIFIVISVISAVLVAFINLGMNWSIRMKEFNRISRQRMINSGVNNTFRIITGFLSFGSFGLLLSTMLGYVVSSIEYLVVFTKNKKVFSKRSKKKQYALAKEYKEFPTVNLIHISTDLGRDLLIAILIGYHFGRDVFGLYGHAYAMLTLPLKIIGSSISQVFYSKCSELVNDGKSIYPLMLKTMKTLVLLSIIPFSLVFFFGEPVFAFVFGRSWSASGYYSEIMAIWLLMNFLISPLSSLPLVLRRQKEFFFLSLIGGGLQLIGFGLVPLYFGGTQEGMANSLWFVSFSQLAYYTALIFIILHYAKLGVKK